ncbi:MAG: hypothetical protein KGP28_08135 [Bdellovibrionales bacterium]|nr:hypothetical protein [Bdellovibrionales bacterium]
MNHLLGKALFVLSLGLFFHLSAHAAKFANQFVEFELPSNWVCLLEGTEWVCQNQQDAVKRKEAIIILAAKIQGDQDTLDQYLSYLKNPKTYSNSQGKQVTSQVKYAQNKSISEQAWVDSLHIDSEISGFYTRYLATVKDGIGILVTYSVNKDKYADYSGMFEEMVKSLKAFRREGGLNAAPASSNLFAGAKVPTEISNDTVFSPVGASDDKPKMKAAGGLAALMNDPVIFYGGIIGIGIVVMMVIRKRNQ